MFSFRNSSVSNVSVSFAAGNIPVHSQQFVESTGTEIDFPKSSTNAFIILLYFILCAGLSFAFTWRFKKAFATGAKLFKGIIIGINQNIALNNIVDKVKADSEKRVKEE